MDPKVLRLNILINIVLSQVVHGRPTGFQSVGGRSAAAISAMTRWWSSSGAERLRLSRW